VYPISDLDIGHLLFRALCMEVQDKKNLNDHQERAVYFPDGEK
jgi:hypothetical protein